MNRPIPSLLLPPWQNESLCETIGMKIYVTCTFICMKIKSFSRETFCTSTPSEKEANSNSEVDVKSACICMCQAAHQTSAYSSFCSMKWLEVFLLPPGWDASPSQGYPQFPRNHSYTRVERGTMRVKCLAQEHNTGTPAGEEYTNHRAIGLR